MCCTHIKYILTENGYLAQTISRINPILNGVRGSNPIILLYPSITSESQVLMDNERNSLNMVRFFIDAKYLLLFFAVGFCGSFTTMSSFALESNNLLENK
jgi:Na+/citrate or Na+/malate symporter